MAEQKRVSESPRVQKVFDLISKKKTTAKRTALVLGLCDIGTGNLSSEQYTSLIKEPLIIEFLVCALFDKEEVVRKIAFYKMTEAVDRSQLLSFKSEIQKAVETNRFQDPFRLLCMLNPSESQKKEWLEEKNLSITVKAALGDTICEDSLITLFKESKTFKDVKCTRIGGHTYYQNIFIHGGCVHVQENKKEI